MLLLIPLLILSCRTPRERAERLVKRANKIFPIDSLVSEKIKIDTLLKYDTTVVVKSDAVKLTIPIYEKGTTKPVVYNKRVLLDNERAKVTATSNGKGGIDVDILFKEQKIRVQGTIKYQKQIITNRRIITVTVKTKGFFWWFGLCTSLAVGGTLIFLSIRRIKSFIP